MPNFFFNGLIAQSAADKPRGRLGIISLGIISLLCALGLSTGATPAQAQLAASSTQSTTNQSATNQSATNQSTTDELLPLTARQMDLPNDPVGLDQVSDTFNAQMESDRRTKSEGLRLDSLPLIGDLVDESGHLNVDLPFDMSISDVMGETGLVLSTEF